MRPTAVIWTPASHIPRLDSAARRMQSSSKSEVRSQRLGEVNCPAGVVLSLVQQFLKSRTSKTSASNILLLDFGLLTSNLGLCLMRLSVKLGALCAAAAFVPLILIFIVVSSQVSSR